MFFGCSGMFGDVLVFRCSGVPCSGVPCSGVPESTTCRDEQFNSISALLKKYGFNIVVISTDHVLPPSSLARVDAFFMKDS